MLLFKVDFERAFDWVDWQYHDFVMNKMNLLTLWQKWIMECVNIASTSVVANGCPTNEFKFKRGLHQGGPLSPFLFLIDVEGLNVIMHALMEASLYTGYGKG
jgi:hypothetical protein